MPRRRVAPADERRKIISFDAGLWQALHLLSLDTMRSLQELADEAFSDLLRKHQRPVTLDEALKASVERRRTKQRRSIRCK